MPDSATDRDEWLRLCDVMPQFVADTRAVSLKPSGGRLVLLPQEGQGMTVAHYRINALDFADCVVSGYAVMHRSDAAAPLPPHPTDR